MFTKKVLQKTMEQWNVIREKDAMLQMDENREKMNGMEKSLRGLIIHIMKQRLFEGEHPVFDKEYVMQAHAYRDEAKDVRQYRRAALQVLLEMDAMRQELCGGKVCNKDTIAKYEQATADPRSLSGEYPETPLKTAEDVCSELIFGIMKEYAAKAGLDPDGKKMYVDMAKAKFLNGKKDNDIPAKEYIPAAGLTAEWMTELMNACGEVA